MGEEPLPILLNMTLVLSTRKPYLLSATPFAFWAPNGVYVVSYTYRSLATHDFLGHAWCPTSSYRGFLHLSIYLSIYLFHVFVCIYRYIYGYICVSLFPLFPLRICAARARPLKLEAVIVPAGSVLRYPKLDMLREAAE